MLVALLSITVYMAVMYFIYFYKGFLPRTKKTNLRHEYRYHHHNNNHHHNHDQYAYDDFGGDDEMMERPRPQQPVRLGATMTRSAAQQSMLQQGANGRARGVNGGGATQQTHDVRSRQFI